MDYAITLVDHQGGKDIYRVTRRVTITKSDGSKGASTTGAEKTVTVEYSGEPVTLFDDEFGNVSVHSAESS